jgi:UDP-glucose 4-epimerase
MEGAAMKAVVTGGAGFIGSHLTEELIARQIEVHIIDNLDTGNLENIHPSAVVHLVDVCSEEAKAVIVREKPDIFFHLAAQADVQRSIRMPGFDASVNIAGTINMLEACRDGAVGKIVFASTSGVYGDLEKERISESDVTSPISYYGLSKYCAEAYIRLFHQLYGTPYTILRYGNVYGPRQTPKGEGGVVALFMDRIQKGLAFQIHGDGEQTRDFVYVKDIVEANLATIRHGHQQTIHVRTAQKTSINDLAAMLIQIHGSELAIHHISARTGDIRHSCLDNSKAKSTMNWQPSYTIQMGLEETYRSAK